jgi:hypothetical protein
VRVRIRGKVKGSVRCILSFRTRVRIRSRVKIKLKEGRKEEELELWGRYEVRGEAWILWNSLFKGKATPDPTE